MIETEQKEDVYIPDPEYIHEWFSLSYCNTLVLHRSMLQSMPPEWQRRFVECLEELTEAFGYIEDESDLDHYMVRAKDSAGRFIEDPVPHYNRGRTRLEPRRATGDA